MRAASFLAVLALAALPARADVDVQLKAGRVDVRATAAPLTEVLDRLARATGMKLVQQGVTPSMLLSLHLQDRTPAEAVFGVLEGLGLNYAFVLDLSGTRIETLVLAGASGARAPTAAPAVSTAPAPPRYIPQPSSPPPASGPDSGDDEAEEPPIEEGEEVVDEDEQAVSPEVGKGAPGSRGNVLQTPSESVYPSSPFAPRAPMFVPQPEPQPAPQPTPPPPPKQ